MAKFWWGSLECRKVHWQSWEKLCRSKKDGGMGFRDLKVFNLALLAKQGWKLITDPSSLCARLLKARYFKHSTFLGSFCGPTASAVWRSLWSAKSLILEGVGWRVGDGTDIRVWEDAWIPGEHNLFPPVPQQSSTLGLKVCDLIDKGEMIWKRTELDRHFMRSDIERIVSIPLSSRWPNDKMIWGPSKDGKFSVKSAYFQGMAGNSGRHFRENPGGEDRKVWGVIWSLKIPPKMKQFAWQLASDTLPTKVNLYRRHVVEETSCERCGGSEENWFHALIECPRLAGLWQGSRIPQNPLSWRSERAAEWIWSIMEALGKSELESAICDAWSAWFCRNKELFNNELPNAELVRSGFRKMMDDFKRSAAGCTVGRRNRGAGAGWQPPNPGFVKVNTDAAQSARGGMLGVAIRSETGTILGLSTRAVERRTAVDIIEAEAAARGLSLARDLGFRRIVLETDAQVVTTRLNSGKADDSYLQVILDDIKAISASLDEVIFKHTPREANRVAHDMAHMELGGNNHVIWLYDFPTSIVELASVDMN